MGRHRAPAPSRAARRRRMEHVGLFALGASGSVAIVVAGAMYVAPKAEAPAEGLSVFPRTETATPFSHEPLSDAAPVAEHVDISAPDLGEVALLLASRTVERASRTVEREQNLAAEAEKKRAAEEAARQAAEEKKRRAEEARKAAEEKKRAEEAARQKAAAEAAAKKKAEAEARAAATSTPAPKPKPKPSPAPAAPSAGKPTPSSSSYSMWAPHVRAAVAEVVDRFPVPTVYTRADHSPSQQLAADFMVGNDRALGDSVAGYLIENAGRLRVEYVIWRQRIWMVDRPGWQQMEDRGSATANHFDHPHASFRP